MVKLNEIAAGQRVVISDIGGDARFLSRITSIGLVRGGEVEMLYNEKSLPLLLYSRDTVIALNRYEGKNIYVEVVA